MELDDDLQQLLRKWKMSEYASRFAEQKIYSIAILRLMTEGSVQKLFPEEGLKLLFLHNFHEEFDKVEVITVTQTTATGGVRSDLSSATFMNASNGSDSFNPQNDHDDAHGNMQASTPVGIPSPADAPSLHTPSGHSGTSSPQPLSDILNAHTSSPEIDHQAETIRSKKRCLPENFNVEEMLNACIKGKLVIGFFKEHGRLDETRRNIVSDILVSEYLQSTAYTNSLPDEVLLKMFQGIKSVFPNEKKELWVGGDQPRETSAGRGKLLTRLYNLRRSMAAYKLIPGPSKKSKNVLNEAEDPDEESESEPNDGDLEWLKGNKEPWTKCTDLWKKTSKKRIRTLTSGKQSVMEYMESYPGLKDKSGYLLLEIDFGRIHPDRSMKLYTEWPKLSAFLANKNTAAVQEQIDDALTQDGKKLQIIRSLGNIFPVTTVAKKTAKRDHWKPSREEVKDTLILVVKTSKDIPEEIKKRHTKYKEYGLNLGPQAVVCGPTDAPGKCFVVINSVYYEVANPVAALDLSFKAKFSLDSAYPKESIGEWLFLQRAVYGIETPHDKAHLKGRVLALIDEYSTP